MNFDRFNPLSSYLSSNNNVEVSDWGIEDTNSVSSHTLSNNVGGNYQALDFPMGPPPSISQLQHLQTLYNNKYNNNYGLVSPNSINNPKYPQQLDFMYYYYKYNDHPIQANTENFHKFIQKYLSLNKISMEFIEKFKYNLVILDLLDDAMILSKNELSLNTLMYNDIKHHSNKNLPKFTHHFNDDGIELLISQKNYQLKFPEKLNNPSFLISTISLIIFLLKTNLRANQSRMSYANKLKMFKILLIISTKIIHFKRVHLKIQSNKILNQLNEFLVSNYKINKKLIHNLINLKELELFKFMATEGNKNSQLQCNLIRKNLDESLSFLIFNLKNSIVKLLPFLNGDTFEKYCHVNNVDINLLLKFDLEQESDYLHNEDDEDNEDSLSQSEKLLNKLTKKMNMFNQLRKLLINQLLTFNEPPKKNFFLCKLWDHFNLDEYEIIEASKNITSYEKLTILEDFFNDHNSIVNNFNLMFENFEKFSKLRFASNHRQINEDFNNQNILNMSVSKTIRPDNINQLQDSKHLDETNLNNLISKLSNLTTNLKFFKKYNRSISNLNNADEFNEKLMIFNQFNEEINIVKELYQANLNDFNNELYSMYNSHSNINSPESTPSSSQRSSTYNKNEKFNLKSFHTSNSSSIKKRFSLPTHTSSNNKIGSSPTISQSSDSLNPSKSLNSKATESQSTLGQNDKQYKRLSTGLQLGLLTVFEEPNEVSAHHKRNSSTSSKLGRINLTNGYSNGVISRNTNGLPGNNTKGRVSYDDNYLNILPPNNYETYNQAALDSLNKRINFRQSGNRFSMNSVTSNISGLSDLLASTQITSFEDDDGAILGTNGNEQFTKEELKSKLEESFNRIYNLEQENQTLKSSSLASNDTSNNTKTIKVLNSNSIPDLNEISEDLESTFQNRSKNDILFTSQLERALSSKIDTE